MVAFDPADGVDELVTALVGVGGAVEKGGLAEAESGATGCDVDLWSVAVDVLGQTLLEGCGRRGEFGFGVAAVLVAGFVEHVGGEEVLPAGDAPVFFDVVVAETGDAVGVRGGGLHAVER